MMDSMKVWKCPFCPYMAWYNTEKEYDRRYTEHLREAHPIFWKKIQRSLSQIG
jgi:predicted small metal-binding protein